MTLSSDTIIASLDRQVTEFQKLKDLVAEQAHLLQGGALDSLQASCTRMMHIIEQIDQASAEQPPIPLHLIRKEIPEEDSGSIQWGDERGESILWTDEGGGSIRWIDGGEKEIALRIAMLKKLIGEVEVIRVSMIGKLVEARQVIQEEMNQLTTGAAATKQYYKPKRYRGARYFDRSQ